MIVNPDNRVEELSLDQLGQIYRGEITNWKDVGGADAEIVLLGRDTSSGTYEYFKEAVVRRGCRVLRRHEEPAVDAGHRRRGQQERGCHRLRGRRLHRGQYQGRSLIDGTRLRSRRSWLASYALSRGLYMYSDGEPEGVTGKPTSTGSWAPRVRLIVEEEGFVPVGSSAETETRWNRHRLNT